MSKQLDDIAKEEALKCFHGYVMQTKPNFHEMIHPFGLSDEKADRQWCGAFAYHCCRKAGYNIPAKPMGCSFDLFKCYAWEDWAKADERISYYGADDGSFVPEPGDIVLYDRVFENRENDHIGIIIGVDDNSIISAEGNINNISGIIERQRDAHIRSFIRMPEKFSYFS